MNTQEDINKAKPNTSLYVALVVLMLVVCSVLAFVMLQKENKDKDPNDPSYKTTGQLIGQSIGLGVIGVICVLVFIFIASNIGTIATSGVVLFGDIFGAIFKLFGAIFNVIFSLFS